MDNEIKIESGIPIPETNGRSWGNGRAFILNSMKDGDSFTAPKKERNAWASAATYGQVKIVTRSIDKDTIRVWRTSKLTK